MPNEGVSTRSLVLMGLTAILFTPATTQAQLSRPTDKRLETNETKAVEYRTLCVARYNLKQYSQAVESCREAVRLKPDFAVAYHDLAMSLFDSGRSREAIEAVSHAIKLQPNFAEAHDTLGYFYYKSGALRRAADSVKKALRIKPEYAEAYNDLAIIRYHMHRYREAVDLLSQATKLKANYSQAYFNLGVTLAALKKRDAAFETYQTLQSFDPAMANKLYAEIVKDKILIVRDR